MERTDTRHQLFPRRGRIQAEQSVNEEYPCVDCPGYRKAHTVIGPNADRRKGRIEQPIESPIEREQCRRELCNPFSTQVHYIRRIATCKRNLKLCFAIAPLERNKLDANIPVLAFERCNERAEGSLLRWLAPEMPYSQHSLRWLRRTRSQQRHAHCNSTEP
ncbi:hypothetical protein HRbin20_00724 [bacterium HR20]|nr:hypothetical protein HRbin20_00724 [bacterium HR20]